jgi:hypothetical protein
LNDFAGPEQMRREQDAKEEVIRDERRKILTQQLLEQ